MFGVLRVIFLMGFLNFCVVLILIMYSMLENAWQLSILVLGLKMDQGMVRFVGN